MNKLSDDIKSFIDHQEQVWRPETGVTLWPLPTFNVNVAANGDSRQP